jgi:nucleoside-diphosphate-sugar epimerase
MDNRRLPFYTVAYVVDRMVRVSKRLFIAGASGAIGTRLIPLLVENGWTVLGMTRSVERANTMQASGIEAAVGDAFDPQTVVREMSAFRPDVVMHQLSDLPRDLAKLDDAALERNAELRKVGTRNLIGAAKACRAKRVVAQSIAFDYAEGPLPHSEMDSLAGRLPSPSATSQGVVALENQVIQSGLSFAILRYGRIYGPGTGTDRPWGRAGLHIDAAAHAARLAAASRSSAIFNIAEDDGDVDISKARAELGWSPDWRMVQ